MDLRISSCAQLGPTFGKGMAKPTTSPSKDFISMPAFEGLKGAHHFYR
jgi:hypothetical protein